MRVSELQSECYQTSKEKGWHEGDESPPSVPRMLMWMALLHSEVSEATEDIRKGLLTTTVRADGKPEGLGSELADVIIRAMDTATALGFDMEAELRLKMDFNKTRLHRHGGKLA